VRIVIKFLASDDGLDSLAAQATYCASDQGKFWEYHDQLMESYYMGNRAIFSPAGLKQLAADLALDEAAFAACLDGKVHARRVAEETAEARILGVAGTPTFFINNTKLAGAQPYAAFRAAIEKALKAQ